MQGKKFSTEMLVALIMVLGIQWLGVFGTYKLGSCEHTCKGCKRTLQGKKFSTEVLLILLDSHDMVPSFQWLKSLKPINWDFKNLVRR